MSGTLAVGPSLETPVNPLSSKSPLFSQAQTYFRKGVHISVKMHRMDMTLCQRDVKQFSASIGHKQLVSKLNTRVHFEDYRKVNSMYRKLSLRTCDARWRSQPRPPSQHKPVSAKLLLSLRVLCKYCALKGIHNETFLLIFHIIFVI